MDILRQGPVMGTMGLLMVAFSFGFMSILLLVWYSSRNLDYWKKIGIPYTKQYHIFGSIMENLKKPFHDAELDRYRKYGRIYGHFEGNRPLLSVGDAEIVRSILVKDFHAFSGRRDIKVGDKITESMLFVSQGEDWKRVRTIVSQTFSTGKIKRMTAIFKECSKTLVNNFKKAAEKGEPVEARSIYSAFTMDVIASSAFSTKIDSHNDPNNKFVTTARDIIKVSISWRYILLAKFFRISILPSKGLKFFSDVTLQIIEERKKTGQRRNDFLQLLIDTAKEVSEEGKLDLKEAENDITENYGRDDSDVVLKNVGSKKSLSHEELIGNCVMFFVAGYDSSSSTLAFTSYLLALNADIQEKVIHEVDGVLRENNGELTYEALQCMKYLDNVISETLRIFPPGIRSEREADEDYILGDTGIKIPKGMIITIPNYAMHRDPEYFPEPEKFNPDRFSPEERAKRNPYSYTPFGAGPRNCVAMRFVLMEMKVCLSYVLSNFRIKKCQKTKEPLDFHIGEFLLRPKDVTVQMEVRIDAVKAL